jgi:signal transduction histidine kinase
VLVLHELIGRLERDPACREAQFVVQEPLGWVQAHPLTLQYVILNLLVNAVTYVKADDRPSVHVSSEDRGRSLRLWIEDNAGGIRPEQRETIFHALERPKFQANDDGAGAGLGLSLVRRGIERMGGAVGVEPAPSGGSRFWIELPRVD